MALYFVSTGLFHATLQNFMQESNHPYTPIQPCRIFEKISRASRDEIVKTVTESPRIFFARDSLAEENVTSIRVIFSQLVLIEGPISELESIYSNYCLVDITVSRTVI